jgi:hypothetical protein
VPRLLFILILAALIMLLAWRWRSRPTHLDTTSGAAKSSATRAAPFEMNLSFSHEIGREPTDVESTAEIRAALSTLLEMQEIDPR